MTKRTIPAISIVIPMYNVEKYIGECLDSILAQTFDDYEVIVVDDCSKDNSAAIVESYVPKLTRGGVDRLQLVRRKTNSNGCAIPRNDGVRIARGEYLMFVDADDAIIKTACQELYSIANKLDADVIHCDRYYAIAEGWNSLTIDTRKLIPMTYLSTCKFVTAPTVIIDFEERLRGIQQRQFIWNAWMKLIRRDSVMENDLRMVGLGAEDMVFTYCLLCSVKRYVRVPNVIYFYRMTENSITRSQEDVSRLLRKWLKMLIDAVDYMDKFLSQQIFFMENTNAKYIVFDAMTNEFVKYLIPIYSQVPAFQLDGLIRRELEQVKDTTALTAFLFSRMNAFNVNILQQQQIIQNQQQQIQQLQAQLQAQPAQFQLQTEDIFK